MVLWRDVFWGAGPAPPVGGLSAGGAAEALVAAALGVVEQALDGGDDEALAVLAGEPLLGESVAAGRQSVTH